MNNIQITISAPELVQAMQALTVALQSGAVKPAQVETVIQNLETEAAKPAAKPKKEQKAEPVLVGEETKVDTADKPAPSLEDVRTILGQLSQSGKQAEVRNLIASFGATRLTEVDKSKYADLMTAAEAL
jgi:hypothetical protein